MGLRNVCIISVEPPYVADSLLLLKYFFLVYFISIPALKSPDEYLIKCTKANIFDRADVLTAFFTYKLLCATVRQRYFCICDKKDVPKMSLHMVIMIYVTKLCKIVSM